MESFAFRVKPVFIILRALDIFKKDLYDKNQFTCQFFPRNIDIFVFLAKKEYFGAFLDLRHVQQNDSSHASNINQVTECQILPQNSFTAPQSQKK